MSRPKQKTTLDKLAVWINRVPASCCRIVARDAGPDEPPLLEVPLSQYEREAVVNELADALDSAQECADRAITVTLVAYDGAEPETSKARTRLVVRLKPRENDDGSIDVTANAPDVDLIKVLTGHNHAMTLQLVASVQAITKALTDTLATVTSNLRESEAKRFEATNIANDAIAAASEAATLATTNEKGSHIDRVLNIVADRFLGDMPNGPNGPKTPPANGGAPS